MPLHIGIVGCSAEGAALCYRTICAEGAQLLGPHAHPEVSLHNYSLAEYVACLEQGDLQGVGNLMLASTQKLALAGANFLICPDNTIHQAFDYVQARSPLPWLHIAAVVANQASAQKYQRVGLLGTAWLVRSTVYSEKLAAHGIECVHPSAPEIEEIGRIIMDELVSGIFKPASIQYVCSVVESLKAQACEAVILGCTEIPLIINDANAALPTLDSTRLLARAALRRAIYAYPMHALAR
jgi:aspartate racemase